MAGNRREIEFYAEGLEYPNNMEIRLKKPTESPRIGRPVFLEFSLHHDEGDDPGRLTLRRKNGFTDLPEVLDPVDSTDVKKDYRMRAIIGGSPGYSSLGIMIKAGEFNATIAMSEEYMKVEPGGLRISLIDPPFIWNGEDDLDIVIEADAGEERIKCDLDIEARDQLGGIVPIARGSTRSLKVRGKQRIDHTLSFEEDVRPETFDLLITLDRDGKSEREVFEEAIIPPPERFSEVDIPERMVRGRPSEIAVKGQDLSLDPEKVLLEIGTGNDRRVVPVESVQQRGGSEIIGIVAPDDVSGKHPLRLVYDGEEISKTQVILEEHLPVEMKEVRITPDTLSPGDEGRLVLSYAVEDDFQDELNAHARIGGGIELEFPLHPADNLAEEGFRVPDDMPEGRVALEITVSSGDKQLLREVKQALITVTHGSTLSMDVRTVHDLDPGSKGELGGYLLPGEREISRERFHSLKVIRLSTGRRLLVLDDELAGVEGMIEQRCASLYMAKMFSDILLERGMSKALERSVGAQAAVLDWNLSPFSREAIVDSGASLRRFGKGKLKTDTDGLTPLASSLLSRYERGKQPHRIGSEKGKSTKKDPANKLASGLSHLILEPDPEEGENPASYLRKDVESLLEELKGSDKGMDTEAFCRITGRCLRDLKASLDTLRNTKKREKLTEEEHTDLIVSVLFNLLASFVLRVEMLSTWTGKTVFAWNDLRIRRTRALKREVSRTMELIDSMGNVYSAGTDRLKALSNNMKLRKRSRALTDLVKGSPVIFSGKKGGNWLGKLVLENGGRMDIRGDLNLLFPSAGWQVISPGMEAGDADYRLREIEIPRGEEFELEVEVSPPPGIPDENRGVIYLTPGSGRLEVEP